MPADLLSALKDIHQPSENISAWPLALGWWLLIALAVVVMALALWAFIRYQKNRYRREVLQQLQQLEPETDTTRFMQNLALLLKTVAVHSNKQAASLHGEAWQVYLQQTMPEELAYALAVGRYQADFNVDKAALLAAAKQWVRRHK